MLLGDLGQQARLPGARTTFDPHDGTWTKQLGELLVTSHEWIATGRHASRADRKVSLGSDQLALDVEQLDAAAVNLTLGSVLKYAEDQEVIRAAGLEQLVRSGD